MVEVLQEGVAAALIGQEGGRLAQQDRPPGGQEGAGAKGVEQLRRFDRALHCRHRQIGIGIANDGRDDPPTMAVAEERVVPKQDVQRLDGRRARHALRSPETAKTLCPLAAAA